MRLLQFLGDLKSTIIHQTSLKIKLAFNLLNLCMRAVKFAKRSVIEKLSLNVDIMVYKISCKSYNNLRLKGKEKNINEKICQTVQTDITITIFVSNLVQFWCVIRY